MSEYDTTFTSKSSEMLNKAMAERLGIRSEEMLGGFDVEHNGSDDHVTVTAQIVQKWDLAEFAEWWNALRLEVKP